MNPFLVAPTPRDSMPDAIAAIAGANAIVLACHISPDGDALGSLLGLGLGLRAMGKNVTLLSADGVPESLRFLPGSETVSQSTERHDFDLAIVVDSGDLARVGSARATIESAPCVVNVDHHVTGTPFGAIRLVDGGEIGRAHV